MSTISTYKSVLHALEVTILQLAVPGKGILAADESHNTIGKRLTSVQVVSTPETRRLYRELLFSTPGIETFISGIILFEETLEQCDQQGQLFPALLAARGIVPGVKVDKGLVPLPFSTHESITQGLDGLAERLALYKAKGARFAKWRAVFTITPTLPSALAIATNAQMLAHYAAICQAHGLVPIVEPELLIEGDHSLERCECATEMTLQAVFAELARHHVSLEYIVLKPSMVIHGHSYGPPATVEAVAQATLKVLRRTAPAAVPIICFLSGGQTPQAATAHLNAINSLGTQPWLLSFSYGRALQDPVLKIWQGQAASTKAAQTALYRRAELNALASQGRYRVEMEL